MSTFINWYFLVACSFSFCCWEYSHAYTCTFRRSQWPNKIRRYDNHTHIHIHAHTHVRMHKHIHRHMHTHIYKDALSNGANTQAHIIRRRREKNTRTHACTHTSELIEMHEVIRKAGIVPNRLSANVNLKCVQKKQQLILGSAKRECVRTCMCVCVCACVYIRIQRECICM